MVVIYKNVKSADNCWVSKKIMEIPVNTELLAQRITNELQNIY